MLEVTGVSKSYPGAGENLVVLHDISFTLEPDQQLAIMGPSGSGKSTLLAILGGLESPTTGRVVLDGVDPFAGSAADRAAYRNRRIGFVFQEHHLLPGCSALDNVLVPALATGRVPREIAARGQRLLERVGLGARLHHRPGELSGGERQRVAVARALLLSPRLILADEPTGQLDSHAATRVADLLVDLASDDGSMLVVVTHAEPLAARVGSVRRLVDGRLVS